MPVHARQRTDIDATAAVARTLEEDVERALHDLPSAELEVVGGRFGIGARRRSRREIARRLGMSLSSVRRLERLALRDLRTLALPSDVPRRASQPGALNVGRSGEANRPAALQTIEAPPASRPSRRSGRPPLGPRPARTGSDAPRSGLLA